ncbi:MAG: NADH-quinone oxidoreductase subunit C [Candidatus Delongbacteria bacterium]|nr:NADH-quinone oxidoreductase subunit C [Candidatus Delongbacteria bacterium]
MKDMIERLASKFNIKDINEHKSNQVFFTAEKIDIEGVILYLKEFEKYDQLTMISCVDYIEDGKFQLTYLLRNYDLNNDACIRVYIDRENPTMTSINELWAAARVYERELKEMFGIDFPGCPRVDDPFVLEGWDTIPPMRKDFDTKKYSEETYFPREGRTKKDPTEQMAEKMYPVEEEVKKSITKVFRDNSK